MTLASLMQELLGAIVKVYPDGIRESDLLKKRSERAGAVKLALDDLAADGLVMQCAILDPRTGRTVDREFKAALRGISSLPKHEFGRGAVATEVDAKQSERGRRAGARSRTAALGRRSKTLSDRLGVLYREETNEVYCRACSEWVPRANFSTVGLYKKHPKCRDCGEKASRGLKGSALDRIAA